MDHPGNKQTMTPCNPHKNPKSCMAEAALLLASSSELGSCCIRAVAVPDRQNPSARLSTQSSLQSLLGLLEPLFFLSSDQITNSLDARPLRQVCSAFCAVVLHTSEVQSGTKDAEVGAPRLQQSCAFENTRA